MRFSAEGNHRGSPNTTATEDLHLIISAFGDRQNKRIIPVCDERRMPLDFSSDGNLRS